MSHLPSEPEFEQVCSSTRQTLHWLTDCFAQALNELSESLKPFLVEHSEYAKAFEIVQIPERIVQFRVVWEDDSGKAQVNRGYRVQVRLFRRVISRRQLICCI